MGFYESSCLVEEETPLKNRVVGSERFSFDRAGFFASQLPESHQETTLTLTIYASGLQSFWSMDSFEGLRQDPPSLHRYLYVAANPVTYVDPSGQKLAEMTVALGISGMVGGLSSVAATAILLGKDADASDYLISFVVGSASGMASLKWPKSAAAGGAFIQSYIGARKAGCDNQQSSAIGMTAALLATAITLPLSHGLEKIFAFAGWAPFWEFIAAPFGAGVAVGIGTGSGAVLGNEFCKKKVRDDWQKILLE